MDHTTLADGRRAQLWLGGADDGPLVLFFHGCPDTRHVAMTGHDAAVAAGVRLLCVNRPGYGASDAHASTQGSVADDAVQVAWSVGHERFAVLGMSIGCSYALATAARHPDRVTALGLVAASYGRLEPGSVDEQVARYRPGFEEYVAGVRPDDSDDAALAARFLARLPEADAALLSRLPTSEVAASVREALVVHEGYLRDAALAFSPWDHQPGEVRCPVRLWFGELDDRASASAAMPLVDRLPDAEVTVRPATTHLATLVAHWADVLAALRDLD